MELLFLPLFYQNKLLISIITESRLLKVKELEIWIPETLTQDELNPCNDLDNSKGQ